MLPVVATYILEEGGNDRILSRKALSAPVFVSSPACRGCCNGTVVNSVETSSTDLCFMLIDLSCWECLSVRAAFFCFVVVVVEAGGNTGERQGRGRVQRRGSPLTKASVLGSLMGPKRMCAADATTNVRADSVTNICVTVFQVEG